MNNFMFEKDFGELKDQLQDLQELQTQDLQLENFDLMYHFVPIPGSDLQCLHERGK